MNAQQYVQHTYAIYNAIYTPMSRQDTYDAALRAFPRAVAEARAQFPQESVEIFEDARNEAISRILADYKVPMVDRTEHFQKFLDALDRPLRQRITASLVDQTPGILASETLGEWGLARNKSTGYWEWHDDYNALGIVICEPTIELAIATFQSQFPDAKIDTGTRTLAEAIATWK